MNVTSVKLYPSNKEGSTLKAYGKAVIEDKLSLDILVMDKEDGSGAWVTFPNGRKAANGKFYLPVFFLDEHTRNNFNAKVIEEYELLRSNNSASSATAESNNLPF